MSRIPKTWTGPERHLHDNGRRRMSRRQCRALVTLAGNPVQRFAAADLYRLVGKYARNIIVALHRRGLLLAQYEMPTDPAADRVSYELTAEARALAELLKQKPEFQDGE